MPEDEPILIQLPVVWVGVEEVVTQFSNQYLIQRSAEQEFILTFGQVTPPVLLGTPEERQKQARRIKHVPVRTLFRASLTRQRVEQLIEVLQTHLSGSDALEEVDEE